MKLMEEILKIMKYIGCETKMIVNLVKADEPKKGIKAQYTNSTLISNVFQIISNHNFCYPTFVNHFL